MILRIEAALSEPPSSISAFRDTTLYATVFRQLDVLLECEEGTRSLYWEWLKKNGAHDFVRDLIFPYEEVQTPRIARRDANIRVDSLTAESLPFVTASIKGLTQDWYL
jgi:hypothetical protein